MDIHTPEAPSVVRELADGLWVVDIALPIPSPQSSQVYLVESSEGWTMIDAGWDSDEAWQTLRRAMECCGIGPRDLRYVVLTHAHPDHAGLIGRLAELTDATFVLHDAEYRLAMSYASGASSFAQVMNGFLALAQAPQELFYPVTNACPVPQIAAVPASRYRIVRGGEVLELGERRFELLWTPGHSHGHLSAYEHASRTLFTGDALLGDMAPNIEFGAGCGRDLCGQDPCGQNLCGRGLCDEDPIADMLRSLKTLGAFSPLRTLPAHGGPVPDVKFSANKLVGHFYKRILEAFDACRDEASCLDCLQRVSWRFSADDLAHRGKSRIVVFQMLAYLQLLARRGFLQSSVRGGVRYYRWSDQMRERGGRLTVEEIETGETPV